MDIDETRSRTEKGLSPLCARSPWKPLLPTSVGLAMCNTTVGDRTPPNWLLATCASKRVNSTERRRGGVGWGGVGRARFSLARLSNDRGPSALQSRKRLRRIRTLSKAKAQRPRKQMSEEKTPTVPAQAPPKKRLLFRLRLHWMRRDKHQTASHHNGVAELAQDAQTQEHALGAHPDVDDRNIAPGECPRQVRRELVALHDRARKMRTLRTKTPAESNAR